jgi:hypothetical protein
LAILSFDQKQANLAQKQPKNVNFGPIYAIFGLILVFYKLGYNPQKCCFPITRWVESINSPRKNCRPMGQSLPKK